MGHYTWGTWGVTDSDLTFIHATTIFDIYHRIYISLLTPSPFASPPRSSYLRAFSSFLDFFERILRLFLIDSILWAEVRDFAL